MTIFQDHTGKPSMLRAGFAVMVVTSAASVAAGIVGYFLQLPDAVAMVALGVTGEGLSALAKAIQARAETGRQ